MYGNYGEIYFCSDYEDLEDWEATEDRKIGYFKDSYVYGKNRSGGEYYMVGRYYDRDIYDGNKKERCATRKYDGEICAWDKQGDSVQIGLCNSSFIYQKGDDGNFNKRVARCVNARGEDIEDAVAACAVLLGLVKGEKKNGQSDGKGCGSVFFGFIAVIAGVLGAITLFSFSLDYFSRYGASAEDYHMLHISMVSISITVISALIAWKLNK